MGEEVASGIRTWPTAGLKVVESIRRDGEPVVAAERLRRVLTDWLFRRESKFSCQICDNGHDPCNAIRGPS